jgi:hypothetical protein
MAVEGTLGIFRLPEILQLISQQGKTGILTVQGRHDIVAISFLRGEIVAADALNQPAEEGLERVLVGGGLVRREDFARTAADVQAGSGRLIDLLVERSFVSRGKLLEALRVQTFRLLEQLLQWQEGDFKFYSGDEVSFEEGFQAIRVPDLLIRSIQDLEEQAPGRPAPTAAAIGPRPVPSPPRPVPAPPAASPTPWPAALDPPHHAAAPAAIPAPPLLPTLSPPGAAPPARPAREEPPPRPAPALRRVQLEAVPAKPPAPRAWPAAMLGLGLAALLSAGVVARPRLLLLPYGWQGGERQMLATGQRATLFAEIDRAAKTFFLLEGRFPERLEELRGRGLLGASDLADPAGGRLSYEADADSYTISSSASTAGDGAAAAVAPAFRGTIRGNFQLDPEYLSAGSAWGEQPLVLLD